MNLVLAFRLFKRERKGKRERARRRNEEGGRGKKRDREKEERWEGGRRRLVNRSDVCSAKPEIRIIWCFTQSSDHWPSP